jgi:hypothetical protein
VSDCAVILMISIIAFLSLLVGMSSSILTSLQANVDFWIVLKSMACGVTSILLDNVLRGVLVLIFAVIKRCRKPSYTLLQKT